MSAQMQATARPSVDDTNDRFLPFLESLRASIPAHLSHNIAHNQWRDGAARIGYSAVTGDELYQLYLASFPTVELRQEHTCSCCKAFFRNYGNLVLLDANGETQSLLFAPVREAPEQYNDFIAGAQTLLRNTKVERLFFFNTPRQSIIGEAQKGGYDHFCFHLQRILAPRDSYKTAYQNSAEYAEDVRLIQESTWKISATTVAKAKVLFENDGDLSRTTWKDILPEFQQVVETYRGIKDNNMRANYLLALSTTARKGLLRIGQTVLGQYLKDLQDGMPEAQARAKFLRMVDPKDYMRPKAAPSSQTVAHAEKIVAEMGLKDSLRRRSLRRDELVHTLWRKPEMKAADEGGVFGAVKTKDPMPSTNLPTVDGGRISLAALLVKIFSSPIEKVEVYLPYTAIKNLCSFVTEAVPGSKPILQWDHEDRRNPVSRYTYVNAVHPNHWGVSSGWNEAIAITDAPEVWGVSEAEKIEAHFVLAHGYDTAPTSLPLFPQTLRTELHGVRAVIEGFAKTAQLEERTQGLVAWQYRDEEQIRITTKEAVVTYKVVSER